MSASDGDITLLLRDARAGRPGAVNELLGLIYQELRLLAQRQRGLRGFKDAPQPTALVHEAYLRLFGKETLDWENRHHFFWAASRAMRDILVEEARRVHAQKRGGNRKQVEFPADLELQDQSQQLIDLSEALDRLSGSAPQAAEVVTLHFFGGLTHEETAQVLATSVPMVRRRWAFAKAWLHKELSAQVKDGPIPDFLSS